MNSKLQRKEPLPLAVRKVVITGPESTGKSKLVRALGKALNCAHSIEFARPYLEARNGCYTEADLFEIAKGQYQRNNELEGPLQLCDTDLLTVKIWSQFKYNTTVNPKILALFQADLPHHYLICDTDIPWEPDPLRENPNEREILKAIYINEITALKVPFTLVSGSFEQRLKIALQVIQGL